jgi:hypothetical protein
MSDYRSWKKTSQANTEGAIDLVRRCVTALTGGVKTDTALRDIAEALGTTHRRVRTLYHRDGTPVVLHHEWESLRYRSGLFFLNLAARLRAKADEYEAAGENLVADQMEFRWSTECKTNYVERRSERCAG